MDDLFLNRMITPEANKPTGGGQASQQRIEKKTQKIIFEISIGSLHHFKTLLKM